MTRQSQRNRARPTQPSSTDPQVHSNAHELSHGTDLRSGHVQLGVIGRPHGVRGEMTVWLHNPKSTLLGDLLRAKAGDANTKGTLLVCAPEGEGFSEQTLSVGNLRSGRKGARILRALEVNNRDEAAALNGWRILIPSESLPALGSDNEFYFHEIEGAAVVLASGKSLGFVRRVVETSCEVLEIERLDGNELLVPVLHETVESFGPPVVLFDHVLEWFDLHASQDDELLSKQGNVEGDES